MGPRPMPRSPAHQQVWSDVRVHRQQSGVDDRHVRVQVQCPRVHGSGTRAKRKTERGANRRGREEGRESTLCPCPFGWRGRGRRSAWTRGLHSYHGMRTTRSTGRHCTTATSQLPTLNHTGLERTLETAAQPRHIGQGRTAVLPGADRHAPQGCPVCCGRRSEACPCSVLEALQASVCGKGEAEIRNFGVWACLLNDLGGVKEVDSVVIVLLHPLCANTCHAPSMPCTYTRKPYALHMRVPALGYGCFASPERGAHTGSAGLSRVQRPRPTLGRARCGPVRWAALLERLALHVWRTKRRAPCRFARMFGSKMRKGHTRPGASVAGVSRVNVQVRHG